MKNLSKYASKILQLCTLSTPSQRLLVWAILTLLIFFSEFNWLENLSLYKRIGLDWVPSIGLTRAYWLLLHGNISAAVEMNPLIVPVIIAGGTLLIKDVRSLRRR
jgi:hypothetical protein